MNAIGTTLLRAAIATLALAALILPRIASADETAKAFLEQRHTAVSRILRSSGTDAPIPAAKETELDALLGSLLDYDELSKRALRDHWDELSVAHRTEFVDLLRKLVQRSYRRNMQSTLDFHITYGDETVTRDEALVHTLARSKKNRRAPEVSIDYALAKRGSEWRVFDVVTDGVSMVGNYRSQFNRIIRKEGWDALLPKMRARLSEGSDF